MKELAAIGCMNYLGMQRVNMTTELQMMNDETNGNEMRKKYYELVSV